MSRIAFPAGILGAAVAVAGGVAVYFSHDPIVPQADPPTVAVVGSVVGSVGQRTGCEKHRQAFPPQDQALGNIGGDPYTFLIFNREDELARLRTMAENCLDSASLDPGAP